MDKIYKQTQAYAAQHGEMEEWFASMEKNQACMLAIEKAIAPHYDSCTWVLAENAPQQVLEEFGLERTLYVLAVTVRQKETDGRISRKNKEWAKQMQVYPDMDMRGRDRNCCFVVDRVNPGLVDLFLTLIRNKMEE